MVQLTSNTAGASSMMASDGGKTSASSDVTTVALHIVPTTARADGKAAMRATAFVALGDGSLAPDGTQVTFSATNGATADPTPASTVRGIAATSITSTIAGDSSVTATSGGVMSSPVPVQFTALTVQSVALTINPATAPADGKVAVRGIATVTMSNGSPAPNDMQVTFTPTNGATADPSPTYTAGGKGGAITLIKSSTVGESSVTASAGGVMSDPVKVEFTALTPTVKSVALNLDPTTAPADGKKPMRATASVAMSDGTLAPDGTQVTFKPSNGATADPASASTSGGSATTQITSTTVGESNVTASAGSVTSSPVTVRFTALPLVARSVVLNVDPTMAPADGRAAITATAVVAMSDGSLAPDGTQVKFAAGNGASVDPTLAYTSGGRGQAKTKITSGTVGLSSVIAGSGDARSDPAVMRFTTPPLNVQPASLKIDPLTGPADGTTPLKATATVRMSDGSLAPDGTPVTFTANNGATAYPSTAYTFDGDATAQITSSTPGTSGVTVSVGGTSTGPTNVRFEPYGQPISLYYEVFGGFLCLDDDGHTVRLATGNIAINTSPITFTAVQYPTGSDSYRLLSTYGGDIGYLFVSTTGYVCVNSEPVGDFSRFQFKDVTGQATGLADGQVVAIRSVWAGSYLYSPDEKGFSAGLSDLHDPRCWWKQIYE